MGKRVSTVSTCRFLRQRLPPYDEHFLASQSNIAAWKTPQILQTVDEQAMLGS
jgi:hypothetical protein